MIRKRGSAMGLTVFRVAEEADSRPCEQGFPGLRRAARITYEQASTDIAFAAHKYCRCCTSGAIRYDGLLEEEDTSAAPLTLYLK
jgi:hypothetical protein